MKKSILVLLTLLISNTIFSQANVTVGPYLQSPTPTGIKIMWRSDVATTAKVMYGTSPSALTQTATDATVTDKHTVLLTGLTPYTQYYYAIYNNNTFAEGADNAHRFKTFPLAGTPGHVRAWAMGDFGKGSSRQQQVRNSYPFDSVEMDLWLWLGDNVYENGTEQEYLTKVFDSVYGYKQIMKHLPFEPCPGNHDYGVISPPQSATNPTTHTGPYYDFVEVYKNGEAGGVASTHELFYSFDYRNVHFVSLNSELGSLSNPSHNWIGASIGANNFTSSPMSQWLHQDLAANTQPWVVVYWHQTPYTDGSHKSSDFYEYYMQAMRQNYCKILEQYGVDLVLCGHSHVYERSYLVHGCYGNESSIGPSNFVQKISGKDNLGEAYTKYTTGTNPNYGTVYLNSGNAGSYYGSPDFHHPYMYSEYGCDTCIGSTVIDVDSNRLVGRHIDARGIVRDEFTIYKLATPVSIEEVKNGEIINELKVVPNPFSNTTLVSFELKQNEKTNLRLMDVTGKLIEVFDGNLQQGKQQIEVDAQKLKLAKGAYTLQLNAGGETISKTIILQ